MGEGTEADPYLVNSEASWSAFSKQVEEGNSAGKYYQLLGNITAKVMVWTQEHPFEGVFDGNGYTITFNFQLSKGNDDKAGAAPFRFISGAEIQIVDTLEEGSLLGVMMDQPDVFTAGLNGNGTAENFFSDSEDCVISLNEYGEAELAVRTEEAEPEEEAESGEAAEPETEEAESEEAAEPEAEEAESAEADGTDAGEPSETGTVFGGGGIAAVIAAVVLVIAAAVFMITRKKKS